MRDFGELRAAVHMTPCRLAVDQLIELARTTPVLSDEGAVCYTRESLATRWGDYFQQQPGAWFELVSVGWRLAEVQLPRALALADVTDHERALEHLFLIGSGQREFSYGRSLDNDYHPRNMCWGRRHGRAVFKPVEDQIVVHDHGSTNGTFCNLCGASGPLDKPERFGWSLAMTAGAARHRFFTTCGNISMRFLLVDRLTTAPLFTPTKVSFGAPLISNWTAKEVIDLGFF